MLIGLVVGILFGAGLVLALIHYYKPIWAVKLATDTDDEEHKEHAVHTLESLDQALGQDQDRLANFSNRTAKQIMTPAPDVVILDAPVTIEDAMRKCLSHRYTRYLVRKDQDIQGYIHIRDLAQAMQMGMDKLDITKLCRTPLVVPRSKLVGDLLTDFRRHRIHLAQVMDEYGHLDGIVTLEDLLEEVVGEIRDEYDTKQETWLELQNDGSYLLHGNMLVEDVERVFRERGYEFDADELTIAGEVFSRLGHVPNVNDEVHICDGIFTVRKMQGNRILQVHCKLVRNH